MPYAMSYHEAIGHLIGYGRYEYSQTGRDRVALALRDLRKQYGRRRAQRERRHMRQICGDFPVSLTRCEQCRTLVRLCQEQHCAFCVDVPLMPMSVCDKHAGLLDEHELRGE